MVPCPPPEARGPTPTPEGRRPQTEARKIERLTTDYLSALERATTLAAAVVSDDGPMSAWAIAR